MHKTQRHARCLSGTRKSFDHLTDTKAPKRPEMESGVTTPPKMRRVAENDYEIGEWSCWSPVHKTTCSSVAPRPSTPTPPFTETQRIANPQHPHLRKVSVSESNVLLDEEVLTDPKIQALLLTVLVRETTPFLPLIGRLCWSLLLPSVVPLAFRAHARAL